MSDPREGFGADRPTDHAIALSADADDRGADAIRHCDTGHHPYADAATSDEQLVHVRRISEEMQKDEVLMSALRRVGALPDKTVTVIASAGGVLVGSGGETAEVDLEAADHIFVTAL